MKMELWIRSQDRKEIRPQPKLGIDKLEGLYYIVDRYDFERAYILGKYETEERAIEILDEIQNILSPKYILDSSSIKTIGNSYYDENGMIYQKYSANGTIKEISTVVYKMPEK